MRPASIALLVVLGAGAALYLALLAFLYVQQDSFLFFPQRSDPALARRFGPGRVEIHSPAGTIEGWWVENPDATGQATLLYFGGNAEDVLHTAATGPSLHARRLLVTCYRGYGGSSGKPGMEALYADALTIYDAALRRPGVRAEEVVILGRSLGSGVATYLAAHRPVRGVILITPFESMTAVAQRHYSWAPIGALIRNSFPSLDYARQVQVPVLMLAGGRDDIIPAEHAVRLLRAWAGPKELAILPGAGHNDIQGNPEYYPRINGFLDRLGN